MCDIAGFCRVIRTLAGTHLLSVGMQIWPAIDIRDGRCVRLEQGDYNRETVFGEDPAEVARHWVSQRAECLHLVDLDGAKDGQIVNRAVIQNTTLHGMWSERISAREPGTSWETR